jgi:serine/threonine protein kinase
MIELGDAISYFHHANWIHRDICPRNAMVDRENSIKLIDFGLVVPNTPDFQKPGNRTGTANYMAPELIRRQRTDQRIDIFSFAVTCYEMLTRHVPWDAAQSLDAAMARLNKPPTDIREHAPRIDESMAKAVMKGLALDPRDRWQTIHEMVGALREVRRRLEPESAALTG